MPRTAEPPGQRSVRSILLAIAALPFAALGAAQVTCNLVPGTGCTGRGPFVCADRAGIGQVLAGSCEIAGNYLLVLGACAPTPIQIPGCCALGIDPAAFIAMPTHAGWSVPIPYDPRLIGALVCHQCFGLPLCTSQDVRAAVRVTITP
jgi:hypothetical protein